MMKLDLTSPTIKYYIIIAKNEQNLEKENIK